jgi:hypothetical protein
MILRFTPQRLESDGAGGREAGIGRMTNPYASFLDGGNAISAIAETPRRLRDVVERLGVAGMERRKSAGKWMAREIVCHLADTEIAFAFRLRQAVAEKDHVIQPFDQDAWSRPYGELDGLQALAVFGAIRGWNVAWLATVPEGDLARKVTHPERGEMTVLTIVETMAGHDENHMRQLTAIADSV